MIDYFYMKYVFNELILYNVYIIYFSWYILGEKCVKNLDFKF